MAKRSKGPGQKGSFSDAELPVAERYPDTRRRRRALLLGAVVAVILVGAAAIDLLLRGGRLLSNGPLTSAHAVLAQECANCHAGDGRQVTAQSCSACHDRYGDEIGVYSFASHYLYRSDDRARLEQPAEREGPCFACHAEHQGREARITRVGDASCRRCHEFVSFNQGHPQFAALAEAAEAEESRPSPLRFAHIHHVREVMKRQQLEDPDTSCLYCHAPRAEGLGFEPLEFDRHCDACHLTATTATPALPVAAAGQIGVEPLEAILARGGPAVRWAVFANPGEYRRRGSSVVKSPVHHRDPWVLENLRALRRRLYPEAGLADLLVASADAPGQERSALYREAIATLEGQTVVLRARPEPEIQAELRRIEGWLAELKRVVRDPRAPLEESRFRLALGSPRPDLTEGQVAEIEALVADLTEPCRGCHQVEQATIARVPHDLRSLRRAEFDHRAHMTQLRCLDCHDRIPVAAWLAGEDQAPPALDRAEIRNLPGIESCRQCHAPRQASNRCADCHRFHPDPSRRSDRFLFLE